MTSATDVELVVLDVDGTLLDSAEGIVAGFRHALADVGFDVPDEATLRSDLGPPVGTLFTSLGVAADVLPQAVEAYRSYYLRDGLRRATVYPGVPALLAGLRRRGVRLATATAKRTETVTAFLAHHGLDHFFDLVHGTSTAAQPKTRTVAEVLDRLAADPARTLMVGDRHSDVAAGQDCGTRTAAALWGYGSRDELAASRPDHLVDSPADLARLLDVGEPS